MKTKNNTTKQDNKVKVISLAQFRKNLAIMDRASARRNTECLLTRLPRVK